MAKAQSEEIQEAVEETLAVIADSPFCDNIEYLIGIVEGIRSQIRSISSEGQHRLWNVSDEEDFGEEDDG
jgi:hypothetical protein